MRVRKEKRILVLVGLLSLVILTTSCKHTAKMTAYNLWKHGSFPYDADLIEYGLREDPNATDLVCGKSLAEVRAIFKDVHETEGRFAIVLAKTLQHRPPNRQFYQWEQRYVVFEVEADRVVALVFAQGLEVELAQR